MILCSLIRLYRGGSVCGARLFCVWAPTACNNLPDYLRNISLSVDIFSSFHELMQSRGVRLSVCLSVRPSVCKHFAQVASSTTEMAGSPPNLHNMVPGRACIQGVLTVKVEVKGHVIRALLWCHVFAIQYGLRFCLYMRSLYMKHHYTLLPA